MRKTTKPKAKPKAPKGYENSKFDNDKGVKENSAADMKRDKRGVAAFKKSKAKPKKK